MIVGSGKWAMTFPEGFFPTEGFVQVAHPLHVRCLIVGDAKPFVLVSVEMTSLGDEVCARLRGLAARQAHTDEHMVWVAVTHTFSAPHLLPEPALRTEADRARKAALLGILEDAAAHAVRQAAESRESCTITLHQSQSGVLASRDVELPDGWWVGCGGSGPSDRTLTVLKAQREGRIKALLLHVNVQSSVLDGTGAAEGKAVSGDLAGVACAWLEDCCAETALFMIGAAADQAPIRRAAGYVPDGRGGYLLEDMHEQGIPLVEELGRQLGMEAQAALQSQGTPVEGIPTVSRRSFCAPAKKMNPHLHELRPARTCEWEPNGEKEQTIELLRLGDLAVLGVKPELTCATLCQLINCSPYQRLLVSTMVNGGAKYMADRDAYARCMYEAVNSPFAPGAAEMLVQEAERLFAQNG